MNPEEADKKDLIAAQAELEDLRSWSDELPEEFMVGQRGYKFCYGWFQGVLSNVLTIADILNDQELSNAANRLGEVKRARKNQRTTRDEINVADQLLRSALQKLQNFG